MDATLIQRIVGGLLCVGAALAGMFVSATIPVELRVKVAELRARERPADQVQEELLAGRAASDRSTIRYQSELAIDLNDFAVTDVTYETLLEPIAYHRLIDGQPVIVGPEGWTSDWIGVTSSVETVSMQRDRATVKTSHSVARVKNVSASPVAYYFRARSPERGDCAARGARQHNAMALRPGETADVVVCAGPAGVEILELRIAVLNELSYFYVTKVPPTAVGHDTLTSRSHTTPSISPVCTGVPSTALADAIVAGSLEWEDIVDFYARHNCERSNMPLSYRRAIEPLPKLPAVSAGR